MDLEDLQSDLHALKKLYGILQSKGNILQVSGSENLDEKSRQLLKKLLDGATERAIQCHSQILAEKSSASLSPDDSSQHEPPTSKQPPDLPGSSKEIPEEKDEFQRHHRLKAFAAEESTTEKNICSLCKRSHLKRQISLGEKISSSPSYSNENLAQMMRKNHKESETRENQSVVGLPRDAMDSPILYNGDESGSLRLRQMLQKKAEPTVSEEAATAIRLIEGRLPASHATRKVESSKLQRQMLTQHPSPAKELVTCSQRVTSKSQAVDPEPAESTPRTSDLPNQQMKMGQKRSRTDKMDSAPDQNANERRLNRGSNQMSGPNPGKATGYQQSISKIVDTVAVKDRMGLEQMNGRDEVGQIGKRVLTRKDHQRRTTQAQIVNQCNKSASGTVPKKESGAGPDQAARSKKTGPPGEEELGVAVQVNRKTALALIDKKSPDRLVGLNNSTRHRVGEMPREKDRMVHTQSKTDRLVGSTDAGPSRPDRLPSRTDKNFNPDQKQSARSKRDPERAKHARDVNRGRRRHLARVLSNSRSTEGLDGEMMHQRDPLQEQTRPLRRRMTWKEMPRQTNGKRVQETSASTSTTGTSRTSRYKTGSSESRKSSSPSIPSPRVTRWNKRREQQQQQQPNQMLTHHATEAKRRSSPRRTMTHQASPTSTTRTQPPPAREKSPSKPKVERGLRPGHEQEKSAGQQHSKVGPSFPLQKSGFREKSLTKPKVHRALKPSPDEGKTAGHKHSKVGPSRQVGSAKSTPAGAEMKHAVGEKPKGHLRRLKNKLAVIFHHHHHHHHHHHLGGTDGQEGDDDHGGGAHSSGENHHHHHLSLWRYFREVVQNHSSKQDHVKLAAEARGERVAGAVGKSVVRMEAQKQHQGVVERLLKHLWHSRRKKSGGGSGWRKRLWKSGSSKCSKKKVKLHWWQRLRRRGGLTLTNRKNNISSWKSKDKKI